MTAVTAPTMAPNSVESAAELLQRFSAGESIGDDVPFDDGPAVVIAAQLLAIATQLERIADAMEDRP